MYQQTIPTTRTKYNEQNDKSKTSDTVIRSKSNIIHKPKAELFPTMKVIPKKLTEVEKYFKDVVHTQPQALDEEGLKRLRTAFMKKIDEKKKQALQMKSEQSKIRWAIEREVKYKQRLEEQKRQQQEIEYQLIQRRKERELESKKKKEHDEFFGRTHRSKTTIATQKLQKISSKSDIRIRKTVKTARTPTKERKDKIVEQIEKLKGKLREQCVHVIQREDALNTVLLSLTTYT